MPASRESLVVAGERRWTNIVVSVNGAAFVRIGLLATVTAAGGHVAAASRVADRQAAALDGSLR